jgi:hypothetical protein
MTSKNYTKEQVELITDAYNAEPTQATVLRLSTQIGKTVASVRAKLTNVGVYIPKVKAKTTKAGAPIVAKATLVGGIEAFVGSPMPSLVNANKADLTKLLQAIAPYIPEPEYKEPEPYNPQPIPFNT